MKSLDQNFWAQFAKTTWERKSLTVKNISSPLLQMDQTEIFKLLVLYSDRCRRTKNTDGMKFYIHGHRQFDTEVLRHLPKKSDCSLAGYHDRMNSLYDDYCLVCDELLQVSHEQQENLTQFTSLLFSQVGLPNRFAEMGLYLGNYRKTPFGVHEDACGVFSFPVIGKKKFRLWKPSFVQRNPDLVQSFSYAKYKKDSQVLEAAPGDMIYWPSSAWHIAESDGSFSATWSLGVWVDKKLSDVVSEVASGVFQKILGEVGDSRMTPYNSHSSKPGEIKSLPANYSDTLSAIQTVSQKQWQSAFREYWMKHLSINGLKNSPPFEVGLTTKSTVSLRDGQRPILWMKDGSATIYGFNGTILRSSSDSVFHLVAALNEGKALPASKCLKELQLFASAGAIKSIPTKRSWGRKGV